MQVRCKTNKTMREKSFDEKNLALNLKLTLRNKLLLIV